MIGSRTGLGRSNFPASVAILSQRSACRHDRVTHSERLGVLDVDDIATTAMMFVKQAARYSDRSCFEVSEAFDLLFVAIEVFNGRHFQSGRMRRHFVAAINDVLSTIPGNQVSIRCVELGGGTYALEWLPYIKGGRKRVGSERL